MFHLKVKPRLSVPISPVTLGHNKYSCLYELDKGWQGFEWLNADDKDRSVYSFFRKNSTGKNNLMFVLNMTPVARENYVIGVPRKKKYKLVLNSAEKRFGGSGEVTNPVFRRSVPDHLVPLVVSDRLVLPRLVRHSVRLVHRPDSPEFQDHRLPYYPPPQLPA